jgi:hypothetical protein
MQCFPFLSSGPFDSQFLSCLAQVLLAVVLFHHIISGSFICASDTE